MHVVDIEERAGRSKSTHVGEGQHGPSPSYKQIAVHFCDFSTFSTEYFNCRSERERVLLDIYLHSQSSPSTSNISVNQRWRRFPSSRSQKTHSLSHLFVLPPPQSPPPYNPAFPSTPLTLSSHQLSLSSQTASSCPPSISPLSSPPRRRLLLPFLLQNPPPTVF